MNKGLLTMLKIAAVVGNFFNPAELGGTRRGRTPRLGHSGRMRQARPRAPGDGRWHMKFHRDRC